PRGTSRLSHAGRLKGNRWRVPPPRIPPFTSAKRTVTCLRSPSRAERDVRIFSARCFGVYERGSGGAPGFAASASGFPHSPQNLIPRAFANPQLGHFSFSGAPHSPQNFMLLAF